MAPSLLYHAINPNLYPTNTENETLLVVRFSGPVRISDIRIIPEGVESLTGPGTTYPLTFTGRILLNVSPSNPINALASTTIEVTPSENALNYPMNMPAGVTTRMMMLYSPAQKLTISIYGYSGGSLDTPIEPILADSLRLQPSIIDTKQLQKEDPNWLHTWCGDSPKSLLNLLDETTSPQILQRALDCLSLLNEIQPIFPLFLEDPVALTFFLSQPSNLRDTILSNPKYAIHPSVLPLLPSNHPLQILDQPSKSEQHLQAWKNLSLGLGPLMILSNADQEELLRIEDGEEKSNVVRLIELSNDELGRTHLEKNIEAILDILNHPFKDKSLNIYLSKYLPKLIVCSNMKGSKRELAIPSEYSEDVIRSLSAIRGEIIDGNSTKRICDQLALKYLKHLDNDHPLKRVFVANSFQTSPTHFGVGNNADIRRLNRLSNALDKSILGKDFEFSSLIHQITPSELISIISPELYSSLSTSRKPPFNVIPSVQIDLEQGTKSFAGKVYNQHEFRQDRDSPLSSTGLGISGMSGLGVGVGVGINTGGLGIGSLGGSGRAASRHVDSYTMVQPK
ncbi:uncharacterized protein I206_103772 [Kwoniella pini CBS 10737]|uniref:Uncharacterized protein n=1 Tax=Kwoniella pini CBS 10737 TaxID=1296096 RepID=A0A1B9HSJ7_9TREE|nr:uncharacterized protein I206_07721 [Kwoniella pini CBS 10737]OCF46244.1 hypothetical protein I206_07721 [Kwoniella pini CBS 10737]